VERETAASGGNDRPSTSRVSIAIAKRQRHPADDSKPGPHHHTARNDAHQNIFPTFWTSAAKVDYPAAKGR
jgi:hypothetical protein